MGYLILAVCWLGGGIWLASELISVVKGKQRNWKTFVRLTLFSPALAILCWLGLESLFSWKFLLAKGKEEVGTWKS